MLICCKYKCLVIDSDESSAKRTTFDVLEIARKEEKLTASGLGRIKFRIMQVVNFVVSFFL
jgi:hypothetical protein